VADAEPIVTEPARHPGTVQLLRWFEYSHLPADLGVVSMQFHHLAHELADRLPDSPELTVALRKLLEGKDAAVRAALDAGGVQASRPAAGVAQQITVHVADGQDPAELGRQVAEQVRHHGRTHGDRSAAEQSVAPAPARPEDVKQEPGSVRDTTA